MVHQLILLLVIASSLLHAVSFIFPCTSPTVSFNLNKLRITGPCAIDTVLAPVGSTVQYTCGYEDRKVGSYSSYWHIAELSGTPFLEGGDHGIDISDSASSSSGIKTGTTIVSIPVKEQYLNNTLSIQCGLCSVSVCYGTDANILSENIISATVNLVSFG